MSVIVHMQDGLNAYYRADHCRCPAHSAAPVQMVQIVHCKDMYQMRYHFFQPCRSLLHGLTGLLLHQRFMDEQPLSHGSTFAVNDGNPAVRMFFHHQSGRQTGIVIGSAKSGRKA